MKKNKHLILLLIPIIIVVVGLFFMFKNSGPHVTIIEGMIETKVVNVASEIPGRIDSILVQKGDRVQKGDILVKLEPNILDAKVGQAKGVLHAAEGLSEKAQKGAREEEIRAAGNQYNMAKSQFEFAEKTYNRFVVLFADSIISKQEMDEMEFKYHAAKEQMEAAKSIYDMAKKGARVEDKQMAQGKLQQAQNVYYEAEAYYKQLWLRAPVSGEIANQIAEEGEVMAAGYPVLTVQVTADSYAIINVRENLLNQFKKESKHTLTIHGLDNSSYEFRVSFISPLADYANWIPTRDKGEFDLKTFEIHLRPVNPIDDLRPGMTFHIEL